MLRSMTLLPPSELKKIYPLENGQKLFLDKTRKEISQILDGHDSRTLLIMGPCSIHDVKAAKEYAIQLKHLSKEVSDQFLLVMRAYYEKPRTSLGWKGFLSDPDLDHSHDLEKGLILTRQLLLELLQLEVPLAAEFLEPLSSTYFEDLISWGCIGARTSASQTHRQMASGLSMPIAFKNSTDGNIEVAIHGMIVSAQPHVYMGIDQNGQIAVRQTAGNGQGHLVLRGSDTHTNYDPVSISKALKSLKMAQLPLRLLVDCAHGNSNRNQEQQKDVFQSVIHQIVEGNPYIRGLLLESHLNAGNQPLTHNPKQLRYAVSITDPCLDWTTTEQLILWAYRKMKNELSLQSQVATYEYSR